MTFKSWRRIATWAIRLLLLAVLGVIASAITVLMVLPRATHGVALTVLTGSMTPTIPVGSVVIDRPVDPGTLHIGDVATYQVAPGKAEYITHRIVKINTSTSPVTFTFKGDANRGADIQPVPASAIRGKVWFHVPYLGSIRDALHTKGGFAGIAVLVLAGYALHQAAAALRERGTKSSSDHGASAITAPPLLDVDLAAPQFSMLITVQRETFRDLSAQEVSRVLGGTLIVEHDDTFTMLMVRIDQAREALELMDAIAGGTVTPEPTVSLDDVAYAPVTPAI